MKQAVIINNASPSSKMIVNYCDTYLSKLKGLMFSKELCKDRGIILANNKESVADAAIHMMFVNQDLAIFWLNKQKVIVDKSLAKKWTSIYVPKSPAKFILELHPSVFPVFSVGDQIQILMNQ